MSTADVTVAVGNVRGFPVMPHAAVVSDISALFAFALRSRADAVFGAEIIDPPAYYRSSWRASGRNHGYRYFAGDETPISIRARRGATFVAHGLHLLTRGIARVSPNRYCNVVKVRIPAGSGWFKVAFVNTHLNPQAASKSHPEQIREQVQLVTMRAADLRRRGWTVVLGGDLNHVKRVVWGPGQVDCLPPAPDMATADLQVAVLPAAGVTAHALRSDSVPASRLHTDHAFRSATIRLEAA